MRKVKFKKWIEEVKIPIKGGYSIEKGTNKWEDDFINEGLFHEWGSAYEEFEENCPCYSVALVELPNGEIIEVIPQNIKFIN